MVVYSNVVPVIHINYYAYMHIYNWIDDIKQT
jgi:hypothetical protein